MSVPTHTLWAVLDEGQILLYSKEKRALVTWNRAAAIHLWSEETPGLFCKREVRISLKVMNTPTSEALEMLADYNPGSLTT